MFVMHNEKSENRIFIKNIYYIKIQSYSIVFFYK